MITSYFMLFLTDVVGLPSKVVGTIFLIAMLFDAVNDPIIGGIADRTRTKIGTFVPKLIQKFGSKKLFIVSGIFAIMSGVFGLLGGRSIPMVILSYVFAGLTLAGVYANIWGSMPGCADYGEWKTGIAAAGLICSLATFSMKVGGALASYGSGWLLDLAQYDPALEVQSEFTQNFIHIANGILPIICGICAILLILPYNLDKKTSETVRIDLEARRATLK